MLKNAVCDPVHSTHQRGTRLWILYFMFINMCAYLLKLALNFNTSSCKSSIIPHADLRQAAIDSFCISNYPICIFSETTQWTGKKICISLWMSKSDRYYQLMFQPSEGDNIWREDKHLGSVTNTDVTHMALSGTNSRKELSWLYFWGKLFL